MFEMLYTCVYLAWMIGLEAKPQAPRSGMIEVEIPLSDGIHDGTPSGAIRRPGELTLPQESVSEILPTPNAVARVEQPIMTPISGMEIQHNQLEALEIQSTSVAAGSAAVAMLNNVCTNLDMIEFLSGIMQRSKCFAILKTACDIKNKLETLANLGPVGSFMELVRLLLERVNLFYGGVGVLGSPYYYGGWWVPVPVISELMQDCRWPSKIERIGASATLSAACFPINPIKPPKIVCDMKPTIERLILNSGSYEEFIGKAINDLLRPPMMDIPVPVPEYNYDLQQLSGINRIVSGIQGSSGEI